MQDILNTILGIVVIMITGSFTAFLVVLNKYKEEIWDAMYERIF